MFRHIYTLITESLSENILSPFDHHVVVVDITFPSERTFPKKSLVGPPRQFYNIPALGVGMVG